MSIGFFTQLFQQFVALLSAFCIAPTSVPAPAYVAVGSGPPIVAVADADPPGVAVPRLREEPLLVRVVQTQVRGGIGIGDALARSADGVTFAVLATPRVLAAAINRGGVAALPGGAASAAAGLVGALENGAVLLIDRLGDLALSELALLGGRIIVAPERATAAAAPAPIPAPGGLAALPAALATVAAQLVVVTQQGAVAVVRSVASLARAGLSLIPGASIGDPRALAVAVREPNPRAVPGAIEMAIRLPIAVAVAASDLTVTALRATTTLTGAATTAVTNVVGAAMDGNPETTVQAAVAAAPATLRSGVTSATEQVRVGVRRASIDFQDALGLRRRDEALTTVRASGGSGTTVKGTATTEAGVDPVGTTTTTGGGTNGHAAGANTSDDDGVTAAVDGNEGTADNSNGAEE